MKYFKISYDNLYKHGFWFGFPMWYRPLNCKAMYHRFTNETYCMPWISHLLWVLQVWIAFEVPCGIAADLQTIQWAWSWARAAHLHCIVCRPAAMLQGSSKWWDVHINSVPSIQYSMNYFFGAYVHLLQGQIITCITNTPFTINLLRLGAPSHHISHGCVIRFTPILHSNSGSYIQTPLGFSFPPKQYR